MHQTKVSSIFQTLLLLYNMVLWYTAYEKTKKFFFFKSDNKSIYFLSLSLQRQKKMLQKCVHQKNISFLHNLV